MLVDKMSGDLLSFGCDGMKPRFYTYRKPHDLKEREHWKEKKKMSIEFQVKFAVDFTLW